MKRNLFHTLTLVSLLVTAVPCVASSDCQITLSQPTLDLHVLRADDAVKKSRDWNEMQEQEINVSVYCPDARKFAVFFGGTTNGKDQFTFGSQSNINMEVSKLTLDGQHYAVSKTNNQGSLVAQGSAADELRVGNNEGIMPMAGNTLALGKQMNFTLTVTPRLTPGEFKVSDRTTLAADISLTVVDGS
ncbi:MULTISPECIES: hypothetical protein [Buttiauxella]|uniref:hypothetical protein n=1 Tax=Buttiauxella TaxID=82976 RepID=UPI0010650DF3|nr:hypothetical protein [Buttiauxella sp. BIGb0552]TDX14788.1 hypothetical protein EDF88_4113 [Buttiauxella sp. BIGb0552]